jgi:hypothetical protein
MFFLRVFQRVPTLQISRNQLDFFDGISLIGFSLLIRALAVTLLSASTDSILRRSPSANVASGTGAFSCLERFRISARMLRFLFDIEMDAPCLRMDGSHG